MNTTNHPRFPALIRSAFGSVAAIEIGVVAALVLATIPLGRTLPLALAVAGAFWLVRWIAFDRLSVRTPADLPIALLLATLPIALWMSPLPDITRDQLLRLLSGVALYYAIANWAVSLQRLRLLITGTLLAGLVLACGATVIIPWTASEKLPFIPRALYERWPLLVSDTVNPNVMAGALVILVPLAVALPLFAARRLRWHDWPVLILSLPAMIGMLVLTQSRGGLLALGAALASLALLRWRYGWILVLGPLILGVASFATERGLTLFVALTSNRTFGGLDNRLEIWSRALYMIQDYPLTGIGMGAFKEVVDTTYPLFRTPAGIPHAHNLFLQVAVDLGIPGLIAWLTILLLVTRAAWKVYRAGRAASDTWVAALGAGLIGSQVALIVHGMTDAVAWGMVRTSVIVWGLWGLAAAAHMVLVAQHVTQIPVDGERATGSSAAVETSG